MINDTVVINRKDIEELIDDLTHKANELLTLNKEYIDAITINEKKILAYKSSIEAIKLIMTYEVKDDDKEVTETVINNDENDTKIEDLN